MSDLPAGWAKSTLGEIGRYLNGRGFKKSEWRDSGRPIIRIQNLTGSGSHFNYFDGEPEERYVARDGDLLVSWAATLGVFVWRGSEAVVNQHIFKVESFIDRGFHRYLLQATLAALERQTHGSGMVHITKSKFDATPVALPPLNEQRRIVAAIEEHLSRLDAADAYLSACLVRAARVRSGVLHALASAGGDLVTLSEVAEVQGGIQKQPKRRPVKNRYPFLRVANVLRGQLDLNEIHEIELFDGELERLALRAGDLLVVEGNGSPTQIGRSAMWHGEIDPCVHQNHLIRVRPGDTLDSRYLDLYWNAPQTASRIASIASSTSGLYTLSASKVRSVEVVVPPLEEQRRIVQEVEERLSAIDALRGAIERAQRRSAALRRAVLERAFRGELVPQDPSDEPAEALLARIRAERRSAQDNLRRASSKHA